MHDGTGSSSSLGTPMPTFATSLRIYKRLPGSVRGFSASRFWVNKFRASGFCDLQVRVWGFSSEGFSALLRGFRGFVSRISRAVVEHSSWRRL